MGFDEIFRNTIFQMCPGMKERRNTFHRKAAGHLRRTLRLPKVWMLPGQTRNRNYRRLPPTSHCFISCGSRTTDTRNWFRRSPSGTWSSSVNAWLNFVFFLVRPRKQVWVHLFDLRPAYWVHSEKNSLTHRRIWVTMLVPTAEWAAHVWENMIFFAPFMLHFSF